MTTNLSKWQSLLGLKLFTILLMAAGCSPKSNVSSSGEAPSSSDNPTSTETSSASSGGGSSGSSVNGSSTVEVTTVSSSLQNRVDEAPVANNGTITVTNVTGNSMTLSWERATDAVTPQSALQYRVYESTSNNIGSASDAEANGTAVVGLTADLNSYTVSGLSAATTYYFNVVVRDSASNKASYTMVSQATSSEATAPTVSNGTITSSSVDYTSMSLSWTAASDNVTSAANLQYKLYKSSSNNLSTVADVESNGTAVQGYTANLTSASVTSLTPATTYYFNVIVKDEAGNKALYTTKSQATNTDTTPATVGNSGTITTASVTYTSLTLNWTKATDDLSAQSALQYKIVRSASNNIASVSNAESNGTVVQDYTTDINTLVVSGLSAATTYYFNVIVKDAAGNKAIYTTKSQATNTDSTIPTAGNAGTITTSSVAGTSMTLSWTAASDDYSSAANLQYEVRQSSSNNISTVNNAETNGSVVMAYTANTTTTNISSLTVSTTYYFNVIVKDEAGNKALYTTKSQATTADTTAPTVGGSGTITTASVTSTGLTLNWTAATDDVTSAASLQYEVRQSSSNNLDSVANAESNGTVAMAYTANTVTKNVTSLSSSTTYYFNVIVKDAAGNKALYTTKSQATTGDSNAPTVGNSGTITTASVAYTTLTLNWTAATDDVSSAANLQYEVRQSSSNNISSVANAETNGSVIMAYAANTITTNVSSLTASTTYYFNVIVKDEAGNKALYTTKSQATNTDSTIPTVGNSGTITTASVAYTSLTLNWTKASDDLSAQSALQYKIVRSTSNNISTVGNAESNGTVIQDYATDIDTLAVTSLTIATTYYFNVIVKDAAGNKAIYTTKSQATDSDTIPPTVGNSGTITTSSVAATSMTLSWTAASDDYSSAANLQYEVRQSSSNNISSVNNAETNGSVVLAYAANTTTTNVSSLTVSTTYYFNVIVKDEAGNKALYTTKSQATTADTTAPTVGGSGTITTASVTGTTLTLNWTAATDDVTAAASLQYEVRQSSSNNLDSVANTESNGSIIMAYTANTVTTSVTSLSPSTTYYFNVIVKDAAGNKALYTTKSQSTTADTTAPTAGNSGTITTSSITSSSITLSWTAATDDVTAGASLQYEVRQSSSNDISSVANAESNGSVIMAYTANTVTKVVSGLTASTTYYFNVIVKDAAGNKALYTTKSQATSTAGSVTVTAPNGGESLPSGTAYSVTWTRTSFTDNVDVEYSTDGTNWTTLATNQSGSSYSWTPSSTTSTGRIRVIATGASTPVDTSDATFTVTCPESTGYRGTGTTSHVAGTIGSNSIYNQSVARAKDGTIFAIVDDGGSSFLVIKSTNGGQTWSSAIDLSGESISTNANNMKIFATPDGKVYVFWATGSSGNGGLQYKVYSGSSWGSTANVTPLQSSAEGYLVAANPYGGTTASYWITANSSSEVYVVWHYGTLSSNSYFYYTKLSSGTWSSKTAVTGGASAIGTFAADVDGTGKLHVVWRRNSDGHLEHFTIDTNGTESHREISTLNFASSVPNFPIFLTADSSGNLMLALNNYSSGNYPAYYYEYTASNTTWSSATTLISTGASRPIGGAAYSQGNITLVFSDAHAVSESSSVSYIFSKTKSSGSWGAATYLAGTTSASTATAAIMPINPAVGNTMAAYTSGIGFLYSLGGSGQSLQFLGSSDLTFKTSCSP